MTWKKLKWLFKQAKANELMCVCCDLHFVSSWHKTTLSNVYNRRWFLLL